MVTGAWNGMVQLRKWIFGNKRSASKGYVDDRDQELLMKVATAHRTLVLSGQTSDGILAAAADCANRDDFERQLSN